MYRVLYLPELEKTSNLSSITIIGVSFADVVVSFLERTRLTEKHIYSIAKME